MALARVKSGRHAKSELLLGLRGVGKTVLLNKINEHAGAEGFSTVVLEAPETRNLSSMLVPPLRSTLFRLSTIDRASEFAKRALGVLRSFASAFKATVGDVEFGVAPTLGVGDSGELEVDLTEVLQAAAHAARQNRGAIALLIDEVQYLGYEDLSALIVAVHRVGQKGLPFVMFGAGLPQLSALAGEAKSYAERLFDYPEVGALSAEAAAEAIRQPILRESAAITADALRAIIDRTKGYPYFLQEWGVHTWNLADTSSITVADVKRATTTALAQLDAGFFRVRFDRLTPREKDYVRAMAELGPGPQRSGEIARQIGMKTTAAGPLWDSLIKKGMIYSPQHGENAFTVPMFDEFMKRTMRDWTPTPPEDKGARRRRKKRK